jgi:LysR family transcriptional activator of glutamate synthase operon
MDLHKLRVFRAAALAEGFTKASEQLHISQSTVSLHIMELEQELGCQLFLRVGRKVVLSEAGRVLLECSERVLRELKNTEMAVRELSAMHRGTIRLGTGATTLIYRLRPVIEGFRQRYPHVELIIETGSTELMVRETLAYRLDLAIVMCAVSHPSLCVTTLGREELVLALPGKHPAGRKQFVTPDDLAVMNFILYERSTAMQEVIDRWFSDLGVRPKISMEMENIEAIKSLVGAGLGVSILPACALRAPHATGDIGVVRVKGKPLYRELGLASLDAEVLPSSIAEFARVIRQEIQSQLRQEKT